MTQKRDSHGRYKADHRARNIAIGATTAVGAVAGLVGAALRFGLLDRLFPHKHGQPAPDFVEGKPRPDGSVRAPYDFRPDATAEIPAGERERLRPAAVN
jgi:hypothetical protein